MTVYIATVTICVAYGVVALVLFRHGRAEIARRQREYTIREAMERFARVFNERLIPTMRAMTVSTQQAADAIARFERTFKEMNRNARP